MEPGAGADTGTVGAEVSAASTDTGADTDVSAADGEGVPWERADYAGSDGVDTPVASP